MSPRARTAIGGLDAFAKEQATPGSWVEGAIFEATVFMYDYQLVIVCTKKGSSPTIVEVGERLAFVKKYLICSMFSGTMA